MEIKKKTLRWLYSFLVFVAFQLVWLVSSPITYAIFKALKDSRNWKSYSRTTYVSERFW